MSSTSNPKITICDPDGTPAEVSNNGLKVDVGDNIELTIGDVVTAKQSDPTELHVEPTQPDPAKLNTTIWGNTLSDGSGGKYAIYTNDDGHLRTELWCDAGFGTAIPLECQVDGSLKINTLSSIKVQGVKDFSEPVTYPVIVGGAYRDDQENITIDSGDAAYLTVDQTSSLYVRQRGTQEWYDYGPHEITDVSAIMSSIGGGLGTQTDCKEIIIEAQDDNVGYVRVGANTVAHAIDKGIRLDPGDVLMLDINDTRLIHLISSHVAGNFINIIIQK